MSTQQTLVLDPKWSSQWDYRPPEPPTGGAPQFASNVTRVPMWLFVGRNNERLISLLPVDVEICREGPDEDSPESAFIFSCKKLHVFASGQTYKAAEDLFHEQVVHFYNTYRAIDPNDLAEDAVEIRDLYTRYFQESPSGG